MAWEPPWKRLVEQLKDREFESPYLDRLSERLDRYMERESLEKEILEEMAYALGRAEDKVNVALLELDLIARDIDEATDAQTRYELVEKFNRKREEAKQVRRDLMIHREALGLTRHDGLERFYPIPPAR